MYSINDLPGIKTKTVQKFFPGDYREGFRVKENILLLFSHEKTGVDVGQGLSLVPPSNHARG
ncbi:MAG: hypothetical protein QY310_14970 [Candidatus Jettenia sp. CY-1]|nr:MAG: hypothetical protein QY310_14970 [Candidatus Jettenia sp. CY-1]